MHFHGSQIWIRVTYDGLIPTRLRTVGRVIGWDGSIYMIV